MLEVVSRVLVWAFAVGLLAGASFLLFDDFAGPSLHVVSDDVDTLGLSSFLISCSVLLPLKATQLGVLAILGLSSALIIMLTVSLGDVEVVQSRLIGASAIFVCASLNGIMIIVRDAEGEKEKVDQLRGRPGVVHEPLTSPVDREGSMHEPLLSSRDEVEEEKEEEEEEDGDGDGDEDEEGNDEDNDKKRNKSQTARLLSLAIPHRRHLYLACFSLLIRLPFSLAIPHFVSTIIGALSRLDTHAVTVNLILLISCGTVDACLDFFCVYFFGMCQLCLLKEVRVSLFSRLMMMDLAFFDEKKVGETASVVNVDVAQMAAEMQWFFRFSIEATVRIVGIAVYMFIRSPVLAATSCTIIPVIALINKKYGDFLQANSKQVQAALASSGAIVHEMLSGIRTVISCRQERAAIGCFADAVETYFGLNQRNLVAQGLYYMVVSTFLVNTCIQATLLYVGGKLVMENDLKVEVLLAFMLYQGQLQEYTLQLFQSYTALRQSSGAGESVFAMLDRFIPDPGLGSPKNIEKIDHTEAADLPLSASVSLQNVSFAYPSRPNDLVLDDMSLDIEDGSFVALVGDSGCGKSTICSLLERFYDTDQGAILFNGRNIKDFEVQEYRRHIALVAQEPILFSGSIYDNIAYALEDESLEPEETRRIIEEAATLSNAHPFIMSFEKGYDTLCGEGGASMSGGQKQRIAIARAIVQQPSLLIFDEATAALDNESERKVQEALDGLRNVRKVTTIVVAHRLSTVRKADKIIVIEGGSVAEHGSHEELIEKGGTYRKLLKAQAFKEEKDSELTKLEWIKLDPSY